MNNSIKIQELNDKYRMSLIEKSQTLDEFLQALESDGPEKSNHSSLNDKLNLEIHEYLHRLAGSSGMYGYSDVARLSRAGMQSSSHNDTHLLTQHLNELRDLLLQYT